MLLIEAFFLQVESVHKIVFSGKLRPRAHASTRPRLRKSVVKLRHRRSEFQDVVSITGANFSGGDHVPRLRRAYRYTALVRDRLDGDQGRARSRSCTHDPRLSTPRCAHILRPTASSSWGHQLGHPTLLRPHQQHSRFEIPNAPADALLLSPHAEPCRTGIRLLYYKVMGTYIRLRASASSGGEAPKRCSTLLR